MDGAKRYDVSSAMMNALLKQTKQHKKRDLGERKGFGVKARHGKNKASRVEPGGTRVSPQSCEYSTPNSLLRCPPIPIVSGGTSVRPFSFSFLPKECTTMILGFCDAKSLQDVLVVETCFGKGSRLVHLYLDEESKQVENLVDLSVLKQIGSNVDLNYLLRDRAPITTSEQIFRYESWLGKPGGEMKNRLSSNWEKLRFVDVLRSVELHKNGDFSKLPCPDLEKSALLGNSRAQYDLAILYLHCNELRDAFEWGVLWLHEAASRQYPMAEFCLATCLMFPDEQPRVPHGSYDGELDFYTAFALYRSASALNVAHAQVNMGMIYYGSFPDLPRSFVRSYHVAAYWWRLASIQGQVEALLNLGHLYNQGKGVEQDREHAFRLWKKAAEQNDPRGLLLVGIAYREGQGVGRCLEKARKWLRKAAKQNANETIKQWARAALGDLP